MAEFDPPSGSSPDFSLNGTERAVPNHDPNAVPNHELDDVLRLTLHRMSAHAGIADLPAPAEQVRIRGTRRRDRRMAGAATLAGAAVLTMVTFAFAGLVGITRNADSTVPVTEVSRAPDPGSNAGQVILPNGCCTVYGRCPIGPGLNHFRSGQPCAS
jgi:hypothetical protein